MNTATIVFAVMLILGLGALYVAPTVVAVRRTHRNARAIIALNFLLGWTFLGWVVAFVWALTAPQQPAVLYYPPLRPHR